MGLATHPFPTPPKQIYLLDKHLGRTCHRQYALGDNLAGNLFLLNITDTTQPSTVGFVIQGFRVYLVPQYQK